MGTPVRRGFVRVASADWGRRRRFADALPGDKPDHREKCFRLKHLWPDIRRFYVPLRFGAAKGESEGKTLVDAIARRFPLRACNISMANSKNCYGAGTIDRETCISFATNPGNLSLQITDLDEAAATQEQDSSANSQVANEIEFEIERRPRSRASAVSLLLTGLWPRRHAIASTRTAAVFIFALADAPHGLGFAAIDRISQALQPAHPLR
jgi:hypothetical protein